MSVWTCRGCDAQVSDADPAARGWLRRKSGSCWCPDCQQYAQVTP